MEVVKVVAAREEVLVADSEEEAMEAVAKVPEERCRTHMKTTAAPCHILEASYR